MRQFQSLAILIVSCALCVLLTSCRPSRESVTPLKPELKPSLQPALGLQKRFGDEIMVCGELFRIGTPVVLFTDQGGYDAYRVETRFTPYADSNWTSTTRAMSEGKIEWVSGNQQYAPTRFGLRHGAAATQKYEPDQLEQIRGGGWTLPQLQKVVDQFVIHYDVCPTSEICFKVLHDMRGLSVHFMLDVDGTIYQTLDLKERTWHATISNNRSIGIEIANMGAYGIDQSTSSLDRYYKKDDKGNVSFDLSPQLMKAVRNKNASLKPVRNELIVGEIQGSKLRQYDFTKEQYAALIKLTAALSEVFPEIKLEYPKDADGKLILKALPRDEWSSFKGVLGHYHVQPDKSDPGPAFQWDKVIDGAKAHVLEIRRASK